MKIRKVKRCLEGKWMKRSLTTKLVFYFLILSFIPLAAAGYTAYENGKKAIEKQTFNYLTATTQLKEEEIEGWIEENKRGLQLLSFSPILKKNIPILLSARLDSPLYMRAYEESQELFEQTIEGDLSFTEIFFMNPEGRVIISTSRDELGKDKSDLPYFKEGREKAYVQNIFLSEWGSSPSMIIATPFVDDSGNPAGVLAAHLNLKELDDIAREKPWIGETGETYLLNKYHYLVSDPKFKAGKPLTEDIHSKGIDDCLNGITGTGFYNNYEGTPVLGSFRWLQERELCIVAEISQAEAFAPIYSLKRNVLRAGVFLTFALLVSIPFFAFTITRPLMSLVKGAEEIGKGKLDYRIKVRSKDEIGILAGAFNSMVKSLEESQRQLIQSEKLASLGQLAAGIAHEINNPLTNISNNAQMLQQEVGGRAAKRLKVIEENIDKASRIVRNLLDFSRAPEFHPEFIDITLLLEKSLEFMEHDLKRIEVVKRFSKNLPEVLVDPLQIQQVFVNLITNACQAMPNGGRLTLTTDSTDKTVEVRISDTGEGIPKEHMDKIFDPFFTTRKVGKGTGLGLSISYRIIDRHGGRIKVESEVGKGSTFIIELPVED